MPIAGGSRVETTSVARDEVVGVLLAAGAGTRAGGPKALRCDPDGTSWLARSVDVLLDGGCARVIMVLGCQAARAWELFGSSDTLRPGRVHVVEEPRWAQGLATSLRAGLLAAGPERAVVVHLVDLPDVSAAVVRRLLHQVEEGPAVLARAQYHGRPGHPVLIGPAHLRAVLADVRGDRGANEYLRRLRVIEVPCEDLATGRDCDDVDQGVGIDQGVGTDRGAGIDRGPARACDA